MHPGNWAGPPSHQHPLTHTHTYSSSLSSSLSFRSQSSQPVEASQVHPPLWGGHWASLALLAPNLPLLPTFPLEASKSLQGCALHTGVFCLWKSVPEPSQRSLRPGIQDSCESTEPMVRMVFLAGLARSPGSMEKRGTDELKQDEMRKLITGPPMHAGIRLLPCEFGSSARQSLENEDLGCLPMWGPAP